MIDLHHWPTPNGRKITLFPEEAGITGRNTVDEDAAKRVLFRRGKHA